MKIYVFALLIIVTLGAGKVNDAPDADCTIKMALQEKKPDQKEDKFKVTLECT